MKFAIVDPKVHDSRTDVLILDRVEKTFTSVSYVTSSANEVVDLLFNMCANENVSDVYIDKAGVGLAIAEKLRQRLYEAGLYREDIADRRVVTIKHYKQAEGNKSNGHKN
jgi:hypothetical protein